MQRRHEEAELVLEERYERKLSRHRSCRFNDEREINMTAAQEFELVAVVSGLDSNHALRVALPKLPQHGWQNMLARRGAGAHAQTSVAPVAQGLEPSAR